MWLNQPKRKIMERKTGSKAEKKKSKAVSSDIVEGKTVNSWKVGEISLTVQTK